MLKIRFGDLPVGGKFKQGELIWTKIESTVQRGLLKPQNVYYKHPDPRITGGHTDHIDDNEIVEQV